MGVFRNRVHRKADRDGEATLRSTEHVEVGSVSFRDVGDDGQAEPEPIRAGGPVWGAPLEGLEQSADPSGSMRGPALVTVSVSSAALAASATRMCPPAMLWWMALSTRFETIWWSRRASPVAVAASREASTWSPLVTADAWLARRTWAV